MYDECDGEHKMTEQLLVYLTPPPQERESKEPPLQLYGIFNAEKYKNLSIKLDSEWKVKNGSLFEDEDLVVSMSSVAPYLVHMPITHPRIMTLLKHYGHGGTLFFWSREGFEKVLRNMRSMFQILSEDGDKGYLAYYRPEMWNTLAQSNSLIRYRFFENSPVHFCEDDLDKTRLYKGHL
jgi:hypothetical protein